MGTIFIWLVTAIQAIFLPILQYFGKRAVIYATVVTSFVALTSLFAVLIQSAIASVSISYSEDTLGLTQYIGLLLPSNFSFCVSVIINVTLSKLAYDYMYKVYGLAKS